MRADESLAVALKLAKAGWAGGDPEKVMGMRGDHVVAILDYENFLADYERAAYEMAKESK